MGRRSLALVLASVAVVAAGCGGRSESAALKSRLLAPADLPAGWSAAPVEKTTQATSSRCFSSLPKQPQGWTYATAAFVEGVSIPNLGEVLATGAKAAATFRRFDRALAACRSTTLDVLGTTVRARIRPLAFPRLGAGSSAYAWTFTLGGLRIGFDLVLFRAGGYDGYLTFADLGAPRLSTVEAVARAAATKAATGSTTPVPDGVSIASAPVRTAVTGLGAVSYRSVGSGPSLLLITGFGGTMTGWDRRFVDALARDRRVITFDNAGIGGTATLPGRITIDGMADQTSALIESLHLGRADVLGWSMGGMIAQALAVRHPALVRRLVLCATFPGDGTAVRPARTTLDAFESGVPKKVLATLFPADQGAAQSAYLAAVSSYPAASPAPAGVLAGQKQSVDAWWNGTDPAGRKTSAIAVPTLVADGAEDRLDPAANSRLLARLLPHATLRLYPDAGHTFLFQDAAAFVPLVESFLG